MTLLQVNNLKVWYPVRGGVLNRVRAHVRAVDGVSLTVPAGTTLGLVGESGCGKTTLGRAILGLEKPRSGEIILAGTNLAALPSRAWQPVRRRLQMIFQDPYASLNPRLCIMDLLTEGLREHRLLGPESRQEAAARLMREVGLEPETMFRYPHEFSGGQRQRISIARALSLKPEFLVCDEPVSALDVSVQAQVLNLLQELREKHRLTYLFISHDLSVVRIVSRQIAVMYLGLILEIGDSAEILDDPLHPYTRALVAAIPRPRQERRQPRQILAGEQPSPVAPPEGCPFHPRCPQAMPACRCERPALRLRQGRLLACHLY